MSSKEGVLTTKLVELPFFPVKRRSSSIHLAQAEYDLLIGENKTWLDLEQTLPCKIGENSLANEYYYQLTESPFKRRFPSYSENSRERNLKQHVDHIQRFYAGCQTAYFIDSEVQEVLEEYSRPSLHQLMRLYNEKPKQTPEKTADKGFYLPPLHRNLSFNHETKKNRSGHTPGRLILPEMRAESVATKEITNKTIPDKRQQQNHVKPSKSRRPTGMGLTVADAPTQQGGQKESSTYEKRKVYGKNLERNWLMEQLQKKSSENVVGDLQDFSWDMFYSPEITESEGESDTDSITEVKTEGKHRGHGNRNEHRQSEIDMFSSTDVLMGEEGELDQSTSSEYEIVIKNNELIEKKTKHKMRKKRQRKKSKYKSVQDSASASTDISHLTDTQLRAMRLRISKRNIPPRLKGKRKFLQVANAVFVVVQLSKHLKKIRESRRKKKLKKKKSKKVTWKAETENMYDKFERKPTSLSLKEKFLESIGYTCSLIQDVMKLNISGCRDRNVTGESSGAVQGTPTIDELLANVSGNAPLHRLVNRRSSDPGIARPEFFPIELTRNRKTPSRDKNKSGIVLKSAKKKPTRVRSPSSDRKIKRSVRPEEGSTNHPKYMTPGMLAGKEKCRENVIMFDKREVLRKRRPSLDVTDFKNRKPIDLKDLLDGIDIPAKEIKIQIAMRKMYRRKKKPRKYAERPIHMAVFERSRFGFESELIPVPKNVIEKTNIVELDEGKDDSKHKSSDSDSDEVKYKCDISFKPVVSYGGISWNPATTPPRPRYSEEELSQELERVSKLLMEFKDCRYIRWTPLHQAVIKRLGIDVGV